MSINSTSKCLDDSFLPIMLSIVCNEMKPYKQSSKHNHNVRDKCISYSRKYCLIPTIKSTLDKYNLEWIKGPLYETGTIATGYEFFGHSN